MNKWKCVLISFLLGSFCVKAQTIKKSKLNGFYESYLQNYVKNDEKINFVAPDDRLRSNHYLKLDYTCNNFNAGVQGELYEKNPLLGYPEIFKGAGISNYYIGYSSKKVAVTLGNFYEQFGNGSIFRSWEDRQIGINNALFGARVVVKPTNSLTIKSIIGRKRNGFDYGDGLTYGVDVEFDLLKDTASQKNLQLAFGFINNKEEYIGNLTNIPNNVKYLNTRLQYVHKNVTLGADLSFKTNDVLVNDLGDIATNQRNFTGNLIQLNGNIVGENSGLNIVLRQVNNFGARTNRLAPLNQLLLNYVPALTKQHHYSLTNIYVYNPQTRFAFFPGEILNTVGELGGKIEWYKNFPKKSKWGGKYGMQLNVSFAQYNGLDFSTSNIATTKVSDFKTNDINFRDFHFEVKKSWTKKFKTSLTYVNLLYNQQLIEGFGSKSLQANTVVLDGTYKFKNSNSIRADVQHMWVKEGKGNWAATTIEYATGNYFSFFFSDLFHYQNASGGIHYYNGGLAFTKSSMRVMASYGRQREGLICVGGVCRLVPASSGFSLTTSFGF